MSVQRKPWRGILNDGNWQPRLLYSLVKHNPMRQRIASQLLIGEQVKSWVNAQDHVTYIENQHAEGVDVFSLLRDRVVWAGKDILDLGCGSGYLLYRCYGEGVKKLFGYDKNEEGWQLGAIGFSDALQNWEERATQ